MVRTPRWYGCATPSKDGGSFGFWHTTTAADPRPSMSLDGNCQERRGLNHAQVLSRIGMCDQIISRNLDRIQPPNALLKAIRCSTVENSDHRWTDKLLKICCTLNDPGGGSSEQYVISGPWCLQAPRQKHPSCGHCDGVLHKRRRF